MAKGCCKWCGYPLQPGQPIHADCAKKRICDLEALGTELIGAIGVSFPVGDPNRTRLIHKSRAVLWPERWRLNDGGEPRYYGANATSQVIRLQPHLMEGEM